MIVLAMLFVTWLYFLFARAIFRKVCATTEHRGTRIMTIVLLIILFFIDNIIGNSIYYYLIKTRGGERIYEQPAKIQGYMIETRHGGVIEDYAQDLFDGRYQYLELNVTKAYNDAYYAREKGFYRFFISQRGDARCTDYWRAMKKYSDRGWTFPFPADKCLAYSAITRPESRYILQADVRNDYFYNVSTRSTTIHDLSTGKLVAELTRIYYTGGIFLSWAPLKLKAYPEAEIDINYALIRGFVHNVFK